MALEVQEAEQSVIDAGRELIKGVLVSPAVEPGGCRGSSCRVS
jgi:hypothetical protein